MVVYKMKGYDKMTDIIVHGMTSSEMERLIKKGVVETVNRRKDAKIQNMLKHTWDFAEKSGVGDDLKKSIGKQFAKSASSIATNGVFSGATLVSSVANNVQTEMVRRAVKEVSGKVDILTDVVKDMSVHVESIANGMQIMQKVSFLNTGLSLVNTGVSVATFIVVNKKLNEIQATLNTLADTVDKIYKIEVANIISETSNLISRFKSFQMHYEDGDLDYRNMYILLSDTRSQIEKLINLSLSEALPFDFANELIYKMLPVYSESLTFYLEYYYKNKGTIESSGVEYFQNIYNELLQENYINRFEDYLIIDKDYNDRDSSLLLTEQKYIIANYFTGVSDTRELIENTDSYDEYIKLQKCIDDTVLYEINDELDNYKKLKVFDDDLDEIIRRSVMQAYQETSHLVIK